MRLAIEAVDKHRQELTSHHLHFVDSTVINTDDSDRRYAIALARASVTTEFKGTNPVQNSTIGGGMAWALNGEGDPADPAFHELAALQLVGVCHAFARQKEIV